MLLHIGINIDDVIGNNGHAGVLCLFLFYYILTKLVFCSLLYVWRVQFFDLYVFTLSKMAIEALQISQHIYLSCELETTDSWDNCITSSSIWHSIFSFFELAFLGFESFVLLTTTAMTGILFLSSFFKPSFFSIRDC